MARLDLATRTGRIVDALADRDLLNLPKTLRIQLERFTRAIGVDYDKFIRYAPSTRQRYIRAARKGRTAEQERARVREQRKQRKQEPTIIEKVVDPRLGEIEDLRAWLEERVDTKAGPRTEMDNLQSDPLLARDSVTEHIQAYGVSYVLKQLRGMKSGYDDNGKGAMRWRGFLASESAPDRPDERWYWYHGSPRLLTGPIDWSKLR